MISIFPDVRKVKNSCFLANVNVDGRDLNQIQKKVFNSQFRKRGFGMWPMKNGVKWKKKLGRGSRFKENGDCFSYSYDRIGGAGRLLMSLPP